MSCAAAASQGRALACQRDGAIEIVLAMWGSRENYVRDSIMLIAAGLTPFRAFPQVFNVRDAKKCGA